MRSKLTRENFERVIGNPRVVLGEVATQALKLNRRFAEKDGASVMDRDWDVLVLLDGCRFDAFEAHNWLDGELSAVSSLGSHSTEFIERNFADERYHDTVYVSANPHVESLAGEGVFHDIIDVFDWGWDEDLRTVPPETMVEATRDAAETYPDKRIVSHFMQPHTPFIGETGEQVAQAGLTGAGAGKDKSEEAAEPDDGPDLSLWMRLRYRLASEDPETIRRAYVENLELALSSVDELADAVTGKVAVSADHGNLFGERLRPIPVKMWGHPPGIDHPAVVRVPWLAMPHETRREAVPEPPVEQGDEIEADAMEERLAALGYT